MPIRWVFDELPPSGARRGGDPAEHAFKRDIESFVREVVQNANDQAEFLPRVAFHLHELSGAPLHDYLKALEWNTLEPHLRGAAQTKGGSALRTFLRELDTTRTLRLLTVEDRNTKGLTGDESTGESHFRALCKDTLYSHKASEGAGGSYGLGKSVLWGFSGLSTVLFNSVLVDDPRATDSPRLIGRVELPSHESSARWFTGSGWFGEQTRDARGTRAESIWRKDAARRAKGLHLDRGRDEPPGTTIQIVGFRDPTRDTMRLDQVAEAIERAAVRYFWPAMVGPRRLRITVQNAPPLEPSRHEIAPFIECVRRRDGSGALQEVLQEPGDVAVRAIPIQIPAGRAGAVSANATADLVVRLASARHSLAGRVAMFRGPGMVIRYWDCSSLMVGMRPFHAVLLAGEARGDSPEDLALERFLRAAEPPGHDDWRATPHLSESYQRGGRVALKRFHDRIRTELKRLLAPRFIQGKKGPDRLQRRFPIGPRGGTGGGPTAFRLDELVARYVDGRWLFEGALEPVPPGAAFDATLEINEIGDDGASLGIIPIESLRIDGEARENPAGARIRAKKGTRRIAFRGRSAVAEPTEIRLEVRGTSR